MTALILKDIATLKKSLLLTIPICILLFIYGIYENTIIIIPMICVMMPLILTSISFGYDARAKFEQFAFSMPIKKSSYVFSKLFFALSFGLLGAISILILLIIKNQMPIDRIIIISILPLILSLLIASIQLPFVIKYGEEKGRLIMVITYFAIFAISSLLKEKYFSFVKILDLLNSYSLQIIFILLILIIIGLAINFSIRIMEKKEY